MNNVYAVIMAGGVGSRFWPASRKKSPKQLLDLTGSGITMIAGTVDRMSSEIPTERVLVVTGEVTADAVARALPDLTGENILAEPAGRNTAPCIGWAAVHVKARDPEGILAVMPSDHLVANREAFTDSVKTAVEQASKGAIVTFGVKPDHPETGFGYIEMGEAAAPGVQRVVRFVEKPDLETAKGYLAAGNFTWNSGMFFFSAARILEEIERQMPELYKGLMEIEAALKAGTEKEAVDRIYPVLPSESVDYGIMEGASDIQCVPVDFGWSDLGSWSAAYDQSAKDNQGNAVEGDAILVDTENCLLRAGSDKLVALVGMKDVAVVDTGDCLLVCPLDQAQKVKHVVNALKKQGRKDLL